MKREGLRRPSTLGAARGTAAPTNTTTAAGRDEVTERVRESLRMLPRREQELIRMRFGIDRARAYTRRETGERLDLPLRELSRMETRVLQRLRAGSVVT